LAVPQDLNSNLLTNKLQSFHQSSNILSESRKRAYSSQEDLLITSNKNNNSSNMLQTEGND
jgi:hypothetical protein